MLLEAADFAAHPDANVALVYVLPGADQAYDVTLRVAWPAEPRNLRVAWPAPPRNLPRDWRLVRQTCVEYTKADKVYIYDLENDAQRHGTLRVALEKTADGARALVGTEEALPCHAFPCTRDMHRIAHVQRDVYRIHHRLALYVDHVTEADAPQAPYTVVYFKYSHGPQVDLQQVLPLLHNALGRVRASDELSKATRLCYA